MGLFLQLNYFKMTFRIVRNKLLIVVFKSLQKKKKSKLQFSYFSKLSSFKSRNGGWGKAFIVLSFELYCKFF